MTVLTARGITHAFDRTPVLDGVNFNAKAGRITGLIGPNGAGKTTLLRVLAGLIEAGSGHVTLDGTEIAALDPRARSRAIAYLGQDEPVHWPLSVATLVELGRLPHLPPWQGPGAADRAAVAKALTACDATHLAARPVNRLSGGERARVLLARALAVEAPVLLCDEPVAGLDPAHALDVMAVLRARAEAGTAIVVVAHDLTVAARDCDRLVLLDRGRVVAVGSPGTVLSDVHLARAYGVRAARGISGGRPYVVPVNRVGDRP